MTPLREPYESAMIGMLMFYLKKSESELSPELLDAARMIWHAGYNGCHTDEQEVEKMRAVFRK